MLTWIAKNPVGEDRMRLWEDLNAGWSLPLFNPGVKPGVKSGLRSGGRSGLGKRRPIVSSPTDK
jgi:hypothetical protein